MRFELEHASVRYPRILALDNVSLSIASGERVALVGPSGAGKTTLLGLLHGGVRPSAGTVRVDDRVLGEMSMKDLRATRLAMGFVPQSFGLVPESRVLQNVAAGRVGTRNWFGTLRDFLAPSRDTVREIHETLERVGISEKLYERVDTLSGGQQQRVAVARALFQKPRSLLADEPISSVDPSRARATVGLLSDLAQERELTLLVSLHQYELARELFPRLIGLREGRVHFDSPSSKVSESMFRDLYELDVTSS
ncbi:MAG: ATP-binding cassette domain-containing protein [Candidatus Eisenbacteria bacterium]|uniref:ATP-binding cassette domain-containing protein n=1 Tax=Eiseniibacteriota bacterium TaxID=2212470 RepID=A0A7Y2EC98_UNCEI|nr:ATP-binding cassette domain-containing protein [Candidatus Eisenbacteria bacterium]